MYTCASSSVRKETIVRHRGGPAVDSMWIRTTYVHACLWECAEDGRRERQVRAREHDKCDLRGSVEVLHLAL